MLASAKSLMRYEKRFQAVINYIYENIDSELDLLRLAEVANMSPYHYRKNGSHTVFKLTMNIVEENVNSYPVEIVDVNAMQGVGIAHRGSYMEIGKSFEQLVLALKNRGLLKQNMRMLGIYYDDPAATAEKDLRSIACVMGVNAADVTDTAVQTVEVGAGKYAKLSYTGPYSDMHVAYRWLYGQWLGQSGLQSGGAPCFEEYLNNPQNTAPAELKTDIFLSLAP